MDVVGDVRLSLVRRGLTIDSILDVFTYFFFFFQAEDGIRDLTVTGVQTCALPICSHGTKRNVGSVISKTVRSGTGTFAQAGPTGVSINNFPSMSPTSLNCGDGFRSEEHTSELQSQSNLVCRLLLAKKNKSLNTSAR